MLHPERDDNYYRGPDLVPADLTDALLRAQLEIVNYHAFLPRDAKEIAGVAANTRKLLRGGRLEHSDSFTGTPDAVAARILRGFGAGRGEVVVLNDETHHCYRTSCSTTPARSSTGRPPSATGTPGCGSAGWWTCAARRASRPSTTCRPPRTT